MKSLRKFAGRLLEGIATRRPSPIILYHHICDEPAVDRLHVVKPSSFERQIDRLVKKYRFVFCDELLERIQQGKAVKGLVSLTFDDASKSAFEVIQRFITPAKIPVTVFVSKAITLERRFWRFQISYICSNNLETEFREFSRSHGLTFSSSNLYTESKVTKKTCSEKIAIVTEGFMNDKGIDIAPLFESAFATEADLLSLVNDGVMFGNHTANHYVLSSLAVTRQQDEIETNQEYLESVFPMATISKVFAVPFGVASSYTIDTVNVIKNLGFHGYLAEPPIARKFNRSHPYSVNGLAGYSRIVVKDRYWIGDDRK
jgi:peptidoglycan/xylan/chitin deacetylase (PgdA/CDA1 family)